MIVRRLSEIEGTERDVDAPTWRSRRLMLADDGQRFSLHDTIIKAGTTTEMWYQHHIEAVYCIEGEGVLIDRETGEEHRLEPGTMYLLDQHDRHTVRAESQLRMVCVFDPPVTGQEVHDETGAYPAPVSSGEGS
ncbi:MAG: ectoine synthase [Microthrixaceae bacterium]